ncbi:MAG: hypothetical protein HY671_03100 [Chloroflexi bacterium]|nr:hypothetical protein [Chloroflexota bacterium]
MKRFSLRRLVPFAAAALAVVLLAGSCQPTAPAAQTPAPLSAPNRQTAPPLPVAAPGAVQPNAVPAPGAPTSDASRPAAIEFARSFNVLNRDWETYRRSYDEWRQKNACGEPAMGESLGAFVANFQKIKKVVAELPEAQLSREVVERLVEAVEKEESALAELRTSWKPGDESAFQKYEAARFVTDRLRRQAAQGIDDLAVASQATSQAEIDKYRQALAPIDRDWDALNNSFDSWRRTLPGNDKGGDKDAQKAATDTLEKLASSAKGIFDRVLALPRPVLIQKAADLLVAAAEKQNAAYGKLAAGWKPGDDTSVAAFDKDRAEVGRLRRDSTLGVDAIAVAGTTDNKTLLARLTGQHEQLGKAWSDFRVQYDTWRSKGGDCDRNSMRQQMGERVTSFHALALRAYALPQSAAVRPLADLITQATEREEAALRQLRDSWKPYDSSFFQAYEKEWAAIDRVRRQAAAGLTDLMQKSNVSAADIAQ